VVWFINKKISKIKVKTPEKLRAYRIVVRKPRISNPKVKKITKGLLGQIVPFIAWNTKLNKPIQISKLKNINAAGAVLSDWGTNWAKGLDRSRWLIGLVKRQRWFCDPLKVKLIRKWKQSVWTTIKKKNFCFSA